MKKLEEIKAIPKLKIIEENEDEGIMGIYFDMKSYRELSFVFTWNNGWEHLSVSMPNRTPTWDQMCTMKDIFWNEDEVCVEYHPRKSDYVNLHEHCLHIWKPIEKELITPNKELVY